MRVNVAIANAWIREHHQVSESALALTFAKHQGDCWSYNTDVKVWLQWAGTHWARRQTPQFLEALRQFLAAFAKAFRRMQLISNGEAVKYQSQHAVTAIEKLCRSLPEFLGNNNLYDGDPFALATPGGTIDLRTGELRPASPHDYLTVITPCAPAPAGTPLGPKFAKFLTDITSGDVDFQLTLQQWFGISAQGTSRDQRVLFLYGSGGNGKGVLLRTVAYFLSEHAVNAPRDLLMMQRYSQHPTDLVDVIFARMAIATEVDDDATWDTALVKDITGGDPMSVRLMHKDRFRALARCSMTISGNKKPVLKGVDDAVRRRFLVATFKLKVAPEDVIVDLEKQFIDEEGPAILRWIIDGSVAREKAGRLFVAPVIADDTKDYFEEENVLEDFINTHLEAAPEGENPPWKVKTSEVFDQWRVFCERSKRPSGGASSFTTAMQAAGVTYHRTKAGRYFLNVHLNLGFNS